MLAKTHTTSESKILSFKSDSLIKALKTHTDARIYVCSLPDLTLAPAVPKAMRDAARRRIVEYNARLKQTAINYDVSIIDLYAETQAVRVDETFFAADGVHPSDVGYGLLTEIIWRSIE